MPVLALRVAVFGATGLAGTGVVRACLDDPRVAEVRAVTRRPLAISEPRLAEVHCDDFLDLTPHDDTLRDLDAVCFCLGISASQAKSKADYRRITHDFALAAGRATLAASPGAVFHFVSGSGASERSWMDWARVKAETERDLERLGLGGCLAWRPGMILPEAPPDRIAWHQRIGHAVAGALRFLPDLSVANTAIGEAMLQATLDGPPDGVIGNREIRRLAGRYREARESADREARA
ncbi:MAG: epimerase [Myxococcota bacterium]